MQATGLQEQTCFGPYIVIRRIGTGGMGSIFEAEDKGLGHRVALKLLHPHVAKDSAAAARFLREGRAAARIRHPHVVQVHSLGTDAGTPYLAMELLDEGDLSSLIAARGRLPIDEALELVLPVIAALAAAHDAGIIHRDLKPSNVCMTRGPAGHLLPKVVDFGVSKVVDRHGASDATLSNGLVGTAAYVAPEQVRAASNASFHSDQYSLAVLFYECLTGARPFSGRGTYEILEAIMTAPILPPSSYVAGLPSEVDGAVLRAMSRDPEDRFPSVRAFGAALLPFSSERTRAAFAAEFREPSLAQPAGPIERDADEYHVNDDPCTPLASTTLPVDTGGSLPALRVARAAWPAIALIVVGFALLSLLMTRHPRGGEMPGVEHERARATARQTPHSKDVGAVGDEVPSVLRREPMPAAVPTDAPPPERAARAHVTRPHRARAATAPPAEVFGVGANGALIIP